MLDTVTQLPVIILKNKNNKAMKEYLLTALFTGLLSTMVVAQWNVSGTNIYNTNTGNVGIGTSTPSQKLHVVGNAQITGFLYPSAGIVSNGTIQSNAGYGFVLAPVSGDAIINRNTPGNLAISSGGSTSNIRFNYGYGGGSGGIQIFDGGTTRFGGLTVNSLGHLIISSSGGYVGIGTSLPDARLTVNGQIHATEVKVTTTVPADFVFDKEYKLPTLEEISSYIRKYKHLPEIPSGLEMEENGIELGKMDMKLLQKIEELTLYMIELNAKLDEVKDENKKLSEKIIQLKNHN